MSTHETNMLDGVGYLLPEDGQFRLTRLSAHIRFLARLAQPRAADEAREWRPEVRIGELAFCLDLLAEQLDRVLDGVSWPSPADAAAEEDGDDSADSAEATDSDEDEDEDEDEAEAGDLAFGITLAQIDTLNRLVHAITAHGDVVAASDMAEYADGTLSQMGHEVFDAGLEVRAVLDAVETQRLGEQRASLYRVREPHAAYGPVGHGAARLH